ncbi:MAG: CocE/NonD family hydrolase [Cognatishimia sp.]|uniref:CocE/NonD family hydrolase n=1 Tax=Cognatishimia sp. TaxID=2211648 RepID=UPI004058B447
MTRTITIEDIETHWFEMPDGTRLAARVWLPEGARDAPVPAILEYIPYRRRDRTRLRDESMHPRFATAGYASIRVDMRGSGDSDGVMLDEYSHQEIQDGHDLVQAIAAQDWCDGSVAMFGKSWGAFTTFQVAAKQPPALKCIMPVMGTDDRWLEDIHFYGGVLSGDNFWWGSVMQLYNAMPPDPEIVGINNWLDIWQDRLDAVHFWPAHWLEHQTRDDNWRRGSISENYDAIQIPVYYVGGWADLYRDTPFRIAQNLKAPVKVIMGPWAHLYPHDAIPGPRIDFVAEATRFFDHHLKQIDTGIMDEPALRFWQNDYAPPTGHHHIRQGMWIQEPCWPSPNVFEKQLWLNAGDLSETPARVPEAMSICSPQTFGAAGGEMIGMGMPGDHPTDCRIDAGGALLFRTAPSVSHADILGQAWLKLTVSADAPQAFAVALLVDEAPDGAQNLITRGFVNLMHRDGGDAAPKPVIPGQEMTVTVPFHAINYRLPKGHRLMVQIASAYWPLLWPAPLPVTLTLTAGISCLTLPLRTALNGTPRVIPEVPMPADTSSEIQPGGYVREKQLDLATGVLTERLLMDNGYFGAAGNLKLDTGTTISDSSERIYQIHPCDPLSARATMSQETRFERETWEVRVKTWSEQTATKTDFHLKAWVECWNGDDLFRRLEWDHQIPRRGM